MTQLDTTAELIAAHEGHLQQLYLTRAKLGASTPPHVYTEIARIEGELDRLKPSLPVMDAMAVYRLLITHLMRVEAESISRHRQIASEIASIRRLVEDDLLARASGRPSRPRPTDRP